MVVGDGVQNLNVKVVYSVSWERVRRNFLRKNSQTSSSSKGGSMAERISKQEVEEWLASHLPTWRVQNGYLLRVYKTGSWRLTLMIANAIGFLAEAADHHPELILNYPSIEVHLETHSAGGITEKDYELARKIEGLVSWYPAEGDALTGTKKERWIKF
jgi:4a-hydroxytetrahydrobiopterin dehydratase